MDESIQSEMIDQLMSITGSSNDQAKQALEACDWNLEMAVNLQMDIGHSSTPSEASPIVEIPPPRSPPRDPVDEVRAPIPPVRQVLVDDRFDVMNSGPRTRNASHPIFGVRTVMRDFRQEARWREAQTEADSEAEAVNTAKIQTLEDLFRPPLDLIFTGNMEAAKREGSDKNKWLMVNVQNTEVFACQVLNRDVWSNPAVKQVVREHFVFWQVYHSTRDGQRYMQFYPINSFPYIAILDPRTGEQLKAWTSIQDVDSFCEKVTDFLTCHPSPSGEVVEGDFGVTSILNHTSDNNNHEGSRSGSFKTSITEMTEEEQVEAAIAASLAAAKQEVRIDDDMDDEEFETFDSSDDDHVPQVTKVVSKPEVVKEDFTKYLGSASTLAELVVRFPDGQREKCSFPQDSKLKAVFLWVESKGFSLQDYDLVTNFPRRNIHDLPSEDTLLNVGLIKDQVYVQLKS